MTVLQTEVIRIFAFFLVDIGSAFDIVTRMKLTKLLDCSDSKTNWQALAKLFQLEDMVDTLSTFSSPASILFDTLEVMYEYVVEQSTSLLHRLRVRC